MPCYRHYDEVTGEAIGTLCGRLGPPCFHCGAVSDALCDFPLGEEGKTCDRPLCLRCAPVVGADKNFCRDHNDQGPGLLLFRRPRRRDEVIADAREVIESAKARRPRRERAPPEGKRWRVLQNVLHPSGPCVLTSWMSELAARQFARRVNGSVETWEQYLAWFAERYPKPPRKPRKKPTS